MFTITMGIKDRKVQVTFEGKLIYSFEGAVVELKDSMVLIKTGNEVLVRLFSSECDWYIVAETP